MRPSCDLQVGWELGHIGIVDDLTVSTDLFHYDEVMSTQARNTLAAAEKLDIPTGTIICEVPEGAPGYPAQAAGEAAESGPIMFKGRAAVKLVEGVARRPWRQFGECPHETLGDPVRVHGDHLGHLHLCQGLTMGSMFEQPLVELVAEYNPQAHPIVGPLLADGPAALVERYGLPHEEAYVDACHLCYEARVALRQRFKFWARDRCMERD